MSVGTPKTWDSLVLWFVTLVTHGHTLYKWKQDPKSAVLETYLITDCKCVLLEAKTIFNCF